jgi:flagellar biosynthetic protein FliR
VNRWTAGGIEDMPTSPIRAIEETQWDPFYYLRTACFERHGCGLYALPLRALADSYALLPAGEGLPLPTQVATLAQAVADSLSLALRLAAPLLLASVLGQFALGLLVRLAPQVPVFMVAAPGQILAGLLLLALLLPALLGAWLAAARDGFAALPGLR